MNVLVTGGFGFIGLHYDSRDYRCIDFQYAPNKYNDRFVLHLTKAQKVLGHHPESSNNYLSEYIQQIKSGI